MTTWLATLPPLAPKLAGFPFVGKWLSSFSDEDLWMCCVSLLAIVFGVFLTMAIVTVMGAVAGWILS